MSECGLDSFGLVTPNYPIISVCGAEPSRDFIQSHKQMFPAA
jgi:hypothetical protein